jgi:hypothetical protein
MAELRVVGASPAPPEHDLPADLDTIRASADRVLAPGPLPHYDDLLTVTAELRGTLRVMVDATAKRLPDTQDRAYAETRIAEARYRLCIGPGEGLKSADRLARGLAEVICDLVDILAECTTEN